MLRAQIVAKGVSADDIMSVWRDIEYRFTWDDRCEKNSCLEMLGDDEIGYYEGKAPPPLSNRDFVLQSGHRYKWRGKKEWLYMNRSVTHPSLPEVKGCVRGISHVTGLRIVEQDPATESGENELLITYVTNGDVGGWVPKAIVNWVVTKAAPGMMTQMISAAQGFRAWKTKQEEEKNKKQE